ncbi:MAG: hypothetical protein ACTSW4_01555 [Candidatus Ranarchaeia archaeon]
MNMEIVIEASALRILSSEPYLSYNKKPLIVPFIFLIIGTFLLLLSPNPVVQVIGGFLALLGLIVGFVLLSIIVGLHTSTKKAIKKNKDLKR